jgi:phospholipid N-methyltransferase
MNDIGHFIKALVKNPLGVGAVAPSSKKLARRMVDGIKPHRESMILELGVGTGAITSEIRKILPDRSSYLGVEIDKKLAKLVQLKFPDLEIINADACTARELHKELDLGDVRYILSGIPFVSLPREISERILADIGIFMANGCLFRTFQYVHGYYTPPAKRMRAYMTERYGKMQKSPIVIKNLPPAVTLTWETK